VEHYGYEMPLPKRGRSKATRILAARSAARTRHKPAARIPKTTINREPKWEAEEDADGRLIWVEGSVEQQQQGQAQEDKLFKIPQDFEIGHHALLATTQADRARGAVKEIKCRVCPDAQLNTWNGFKRHCETAEGTHSESTSVTTVEISSRAATRSSGTARTHLMSASRFHPRIPKRSAE